MKETIALVSGATLFDVVVPSLVMVGSLVLVLPFLNSRSASARGVLIALCLFLMWRYMAWRISETLPPVENTLEFSIGLVFIVIEFLSVIAASLGLLFMLRKRWRSKDADAGVARLHRDGAEPRIDIFICTYNENVSVVAPTILGALNIDYANKRVWVLDDGRRPWLKHLCDVAECGYIARSDNKHAKAGNINHALSYVAQLEETPEYIAILDADFVAHPKFLERTLALMHYDNNVAVVQTPQHFMNADPIQRNLAAEHVWPDEQRYFYDVILKTKDAWNLAFCCGTSSLIRFSALCELGGFPTSSVTEDYLLSVCLREEGYQTIYLNERLSVGLAPESLEAYLTQRGRWSLGFVQMVRGPHGPFSMNPKVSLLERISMFETFLYWSASHAFRVLAIIVPAIYLLFDIKAVYAGLYAAIDHVLPFLLVSALVNGWLTQWRVLPLMSDVSQLLSAHTVLKSVIAGTLRPKSQRFKVTLKGANRKQSFVAWPMMTVFLGYLALTTVAIIWAFAINNNMGLRDSTAVALFWCWYNTLVLVLACLICIEEPRQDARVRVEGELEVARDGHSVNCQTVDVSLGGVRLKGTCPFPLHAVVSVGMGGYSVDGWVVRVTDVDFAIKFVSRSEKLKRLLVHRDHDLKTAAGVSHPLSVAHAVMGRIFR